MPEQDINLLAFCNSSSISHWTHWVREESTLFEDMQNGWTGKNHLAQQYVVTGRLHRLR